MSIAPLAVRSAARSLRVKNAPCTFRYAAGKGSRVIVFRPWVGSRFIDGGVRILLLGESHYGEPHADAAQSTIHVVEQWKTRGWPVRYLTTAARLMTGKQAGQIDRSNDLEAIAFYNFIQVGMDTIRRRPSWAQFQASRPAFQAVLQQLDPTHILATGAGLWNAMPDFDVGGGGEQINLAGQTRLVGRYSTPSGSALATSVPHLSRGFSPQYWHEPISAFRALKS